MASEDGENESGHQIQLQPAGLSRLLADDPVVRDCVRSLFADLPQERRKLRALARTENWSRKDLGKKLKEARITRERVANAYSKEIRLRHPITHDALDQRLKNFGQGSITLFIEQGRREVIAQCMARSDSMTLNDVADHVGCSREVLKKWFATSRFEMPMEWMSQQQRASLLRKRDA